MCSVDKATSVFVVLFRYPGFYGSVAPRFRESIVERLCFPTMAWWLEGRSAPGGLERDTACVGSLGCRRRYGAQGEMFENQTVAVGALLAEDDGAP